MHSLARCSDPSPTRTLVPSRSRRIHSLLSRIAHAGLLLSALLLVGTAGLASGAEKRLRVEALVPDTVKAVDHNTTRSNKGISGGSSETFALACELHCETGGWRIEVSESMASDDAVLGFWPEDTIYTLGADLYQPGDSYITLATAADGYLVNYPGEAPTAIVGPVYERYGPSPQPSIVYAPPIDDGGISFCDPDPATGSAPLTSLLDILESEGIADTETLPLACEDHTRIEAYAKDPNAGTPGETRSAIELMIVVALLPASGVAHDTTESLTLLPERIEFDTATESGDMTPRPLDIGPDLFESSNGGHPTTKEACEAAGGVWKCDPEMKSCFCFLPVKPQRSLSGGEGQGDDTQLSESEVTLRRGNNDPIPGIDIIVEKDTEENPAAGNGSGGGGGGGPGNSTATAIEYGLIAALASPNGDGTETGGSTVSAAIRTLNSPGAGATTRTRDKKTKITAKKVGKFKAGSSLSTKVN